MNQLTFSFQPHTARAKSHRRYVVGFKEVRKFLVVGRLRLVIIAPDLEKNAEVDNIVNDLKLIADEKSIPYLFSIKRRKIGYILLKKVPVSCIGVFDYQGVHEKVQDLLKLVDAEKINYRASAVQRDHWLLWNLDEAICADLIEWWA